MRWRLIITPPLKGETNMAIDEAIMRSQREGEVPPTVRFYSWAPPTLSLGAFQRADREVDLKELARLGIGLVRRPTGGRAVLHDDEVTYSFIIPEGHPMVPKGVRESYQVAATAIVSGLRRMGVDAEMVGRTEKTLARLAKSDAGDAARSATPGETGTFDGAVGDSRIRPDLVGTGIGQPDVAHLRTVNPLVSPGHAPACFDSSSWYEITVGGRKLVGSAQWRDRGMLLQHGSILLGIDVELLIAVLRFSSHERRELSRRVLKERTTTVTQELGRRVSFDETVEALIDGFIQLFGDRPDIGGLTDHELALADSLKNEKYACDEWTFRK